MNDKIYTQSYKDKPTIDGVKIFIIKTSSGEDGDFTELLRLTENGELELVPGFTLAQINRSTMFPGSIKAWHIHANQDELWYVPPDSRLLTGLWDIRETSPTKDVSMRIAMGGSTNKMVYIPRGVAHGCTNVSEKKSEMLYFVNGLFNKEQPDEKRLPWDAHGADFWVPERD